MHIQGQGKNWAAVFFKGTGHSYRDYVSLDVIPKSGKQIHSSVSASFPITNSTYVYTVEAVIFKFQKFII